MLDFNAVSSLTKELTALVLLIGCMTESSPLCRGRIMVERNRPSQCPEDSVVYRRFLINGIEYPSDKGKPGAAEVRLPGGCLV
jgi:hypothetical protein